MNPLRILAFIGIEKCENIKKEREFQNSVLKDIKAIPVTHVCSHDNL
jgi:hypothetical protein